MVTIDRQSTRSRAGWVALVGALVLSGWVVPDAHASRFAYVANSAKDSISIFAVNANSGALTPAGSVGTAQRPVALTIDPTARVVLTAHGTAPGRLESFVIDPATGALTPAAAVGVGNNPVALAMDPTGRFAWVAHSGLFALTALRVAGTGAMVLVQNVPIGQPQRAVAVHPTEPVVYVATADGQILFLRHLGGGFLAQFGGVRVNGLPDALVIDPTGRFLFAAAEGQSRIIPLVIEPGGVLTAIAPDQPIDRPVALAVEKTGRFLYAASRNNTVSAFNISPSDGRLLLIDTESGLTNPESVSVEPSGRFLYVTRNDGALGSVTRLLIDRTNGSLTAFAPVQAGGSPVALAVAHPDERFAFVARPLGAGFAIRTHQIDRNSGTLSVNGTPEITDRYFRDLALDSMGRFLFALEGQGSPPATGAAEVVTYSVNLQTGALTFGFAVSLTFDARPLQLLAEPTGRFLFVTCDCPGSQIRTYAINQVTGMLTLVAVVNLGPDFVPAPPLQGTDPAGRFLYVGRWIFRVAVDGRLLRVGDFGMDANSVAVFDPLGRFVLTVTDTVITKRPRDPMTGSVGDRRDFPGCGPSGCPPGDLLHLEIDARGRFLYAVRPQHVSVFRIDSTEVVFVADHELASPFLGGDFDIAVAFEASGRFLYVPVGGGIGDSIRLLTVDLDSGAFTSESTALGIALPVGIVTSGPMR